MPLGFGCEMRNQECNPRGAKDGRENNERPPGIGGSMHVRLVDQGELSEKEQIVEKGY